MLHEFLVTNREELVRRCRVKVSKRPSPRPTDEEIQFGVPMFLDQLVETLQLEQKTAQSHGDKGDSSSAHDEVSGAPEPEPAPAPSDIGKTAAKHGKELLKKGFTVDQVVHDYGDVCQAVTELALERSAPVTTDEFRTLNRCLDDAIADAVTEFSKHRDRGISDEGIRASNERLGVFAHELRNALNTAALAFSAIKSGRVAFGGATGAVLDRSLSTMRSLVDRSLSEVRLAAGIPMLREPIPIAEFIEELQASAAMEASARGLEFTVKMAAAGLAVKADRQILASAISNLLSNAFKFTRAHGHVWLRARADGDVILIEVEDECGGLPTQKIEEMFRPFEQHSDDRSGLGLGLAISRRAIEANGGTLRAHSVDGRGCVFTVELPKW